MNLLVIILLQAQCVPDLSIIGLFHRMQLKIKIIQRLNLQCPVLAVGGSYYPALGGNVTNCTVSSCTLYAMKTLAQNVQGIQIPNSAHWGPEEWPDFNKNA